VPLSALAGGTLVLVTDSAVLASGLDATLSTGVAIVLVGTPLMLALIRRCAAWSGVLHAGPERTASGRATRFVGWLDGLRWPRRTALFALAGALVLVVGTSAGPEWLTPARCRAALSGGDPVARMLIDLRLPRLMCAMLAGALLAASGVAMQSVVRNPLAGPEVLGVTQGAALVTLFALTRWPLAGQGAHARAEPSAPLRAARGRADRDRDRHTADDAVGMADHAGKRAARALRRVARRRHLRAQLGRSRDAAAVVRARREVPVGRRVDCTDPRATGTVVARHWVATRVAMCCFSYARGALRPPGKALRPELKSPVGISIDLRRPTRLVNHAHARLRYLELVVQHAQVAHRQRERRSLVEHLRFLRERRCGRQLAVAVRAVRHLLDHVDAGEYRGGLVVELVRALQRAVGVIQAPDVEERDPGELTQHAILRDVRALAAIAHRSADRFLHTNFC